MKTFHIACALVFLLPPGIIIAQEQPPVGKYVTMIESGEVDPVKAELPSLLEKYPNDPGVLYLKALLTPEGADAVRIYQGIVDSHPKSEWADNALYKVYQFYQAIGLFKTAELKLNQLRKEYPTSKYARSSGGVDTKTAPGEGVSGSTQPGKGQTGPALQGQFALQVGAYTTMVNAEKQKLFFEDLGYPVEVINKVKDGRSLYSVNVGNFATYDEAKAKSGEIKKKYNIDSFVVTR